MPATTIPPGPGIDPDQRRDDQQDHPDAKIDHSTIGLSKSLRQTSRHPMRVDVVIHLGSRKALAGKVRSGLALLRRARGMSA